MVFLAVDFAVEPLAVVALAVVRLTGVLAVERLTVVFWAGDAVVARLAVLGFVAGAFGSGRVFRAASWGVAATGRAHPYGN